MVLWGVRGEKGHEKWADLTNGEIRLAQIVHDNADHNHDIVDFPIPMRQKVGSEGNLLYNGQKDYK